MLLFEIIECFFTVENFLKYEITLSKGHRTSSALLLWFNAVAYIFMLRDFQVEIFLRI